METKGFTPVEQIEAEQTRVDVALVNFAHAQQAWAEVKRARDRVAGSHTSHDRHGNPSAELRAAEEALDDAATALVAPRSTLEAARARLSTLEQRSQTAALVGRVTDEQGPR